MATGRSVRSVHRATFGAKSESELN
jgi:hypothetical protein